MDALIPFPHHQSAHCESGVTAKAYWLPYFPSAFRFHFNMHNLVVIGREGDHYLISDPVFEKVVRCDRDVLQRARFAKGTLAELCRFRGKDVQRAGQSRRHL